MSFNGAVEATKFLRDRKQPLDSRLDVAEQILEGTLDVILPRKDTVILEWVFDMIATDDGAAKNSRMWRFGAELWTRIPPSASSRALKTHKLVARATEAIKDGSEEIIEVVTDSTLLFTSSTHTLSQTSDAQAASLLRAYLSNAACVKLERLGALVFETVKARRGLFNKADPSMLDLLRNEPVYSRRHHYLKGYLSVGTNTVLAASLATSEPYLTEAVQAVCETDTLMKERIVELCLSIPAKISLILSVLVASGVRRPGLVPPVLEHIFAQNLTEYWDALDKCLELDPEALLGDKGYLERLTCEPSLPDSLMAKILDKLTGLRMLMTFLPTWAPSAKGSDALRLATLKAIGSLPPAQLAQLLRTALGKTALLEATVDSTSYEMASSSAVSAALKEVLASPVASNQVKCAILELLPEAASELAVETLENQKDSSELALRSLELKSDATTADQLGKIKATDYNRLVLRFFPLLEAKLPSPEAVERLIKKTTESTRLELAQNAYALECRNITSALIERAVRKRELVVLHNLPKQVFSWDQRHRAVLVALEGSASDFQLRASIVSHLLDVQNFPPSERFADFLNAASPCAAEVSHVAQLVRAVRKNRSYVTEVIDRLQAGWLKWLAVASAFGGDSEPTSGPISSDDLPQGLYDWLKTASKEPQLREPLLLTLGLLPESQPQVRELAQSLAREEIKNKGALDARLFGILSRQPYHWSTVAALFLFVADDDSRATAEAAFLEMCRSLSSDAVTALLYAAVEDAQYAVLRALASHLVLRSDDAQTHAHRQAITSAVSRGTAGVPPHFWRFCDALVRECPYLLTQYSMETMLEIITRQGAQLHDWDERALVLSRLLLLRRAALRNRLHLVVSCLTELLKGIRVTVQAHIFTRLVENLCRPTQTGSGGRTAQQELTSLVARERRHVARNAGVLLQNLVFTILHTAGDVAGAGAGSSSMTSGASSTVRKEEWTEISAQLRQACLIIVDLVYGDGLKAISAGMDTASRAYLRSVFDDYKLHGHWSQD